MHEKNKSTNTTESSINKTTTALGRPEALLEKSQHDIESFTIERNDEDTVYSTGLKTAAVMVFLYLAIFLVALVTTTRFTPR